MNLLLWLENSALGVWTRESEWGYPIVLISHTVGMALVVGGVLTLALRVLLARSATALPWFDTIFRLAWLGFAINLASGLVLFSGSPRRFVANPAFQVKLAALAVAAFSIWLLARRLEVENQSSPAATASRSTRAVAATSILLWFVAISAGRLMAYIHVSIGP
jgi:hypothetical protein